MLSWFCLSWISRIIYEVDTREITVGVPAHSWCVSSNASNPHQRLRAIHSAFWPGQAGQHSSSFDKQRHKVTFEGCSPFAFFLLFKTWKSHTNTQLLDINGPVKMHLTQALLLLAILATGVIAQCKMPNTQTCNAAGTAVISCDAKLIGTIVHPCDSPCFCMGNPNPLACYYQGQICPPG
ncbi:hypothetical protein EJ03DRAFT_78613 [Teratosphaeria nubilosa]|uniref:Uncharacterized protein n=1 Tax=Teratosphaeria nubilosa TaxID=161662 RepID=A0A6G1LBJ0_9PEZI|nr:hypothetical protein EJ03DRAFT_78613 [Teratosphaeria nubilosa]